MAMAPLLGIPGKMKTMLDRLTASRASNLDNLDATVSSRAPASSALNTSIWTNARALLLDQIPGITSVLARLDVPVSTAGKAALVAHAEISVTGNGSTSEHAVNLGRTFDIGRSVVQVSTPANGSSMRVAVPFFSWNGGSQLLVRFLDGSGLEAIPASSSFIVTVKEFTE